jgi:flagellar basal-body rod modification protein FlgD
MEISGLGSSGSGWSLGRITNLDVTAFLNLLTTQMRYQNPLDPQSDAQFLDQMASLSTVQELRDLNTQTSYATQAQMIAEASSLIGKVVEGTSYLTGAAVSGTVSEIHSDGILTLLVIGDDAIEIGSVQRAYDPAPSQSVSALDLERAAGLVGKTVTGVADGGAVVRGTVSAVQSDGKTCYLEIAPEGEGDEATAVLVDIAKLVTYDGADASGALSQSSWLLGHKVTCADPDSEDPDAVISGVVTGMRLAGGAVLIEVNGKEVALEDLRTVS